MESLETFEELVERAIKGTYSGCWCWKGRFMVMAEGSADYQLISCSGVRLYDKSTHHLPVVALDLTLGDVPDGSIIAMRNIVVAALEKRGIAFLPVSYLALSRVNNRSALKLVDRDGLQCVFAVADRYYISGYDANESPPLYFLARLPHAVENYKEALEALKPASVKLAESQGLSVLRQGDMFFIPTSYTEHDLKELDASFGAERIETSVIRVARPSYVREYRRAFSYNPTSAHEGKSYSVDDDGNITVEKLHRLGFYGTAHTATEIARLPGGTMFARGTVAHDPWATLHENRRPDHSPLELGSSWYVVAKNTVPIHKT